MDDQNSRDDAPAEAGPGIGGPRFGPVGGPSGGQEALRGGSLTPAAGTFESESRKGAARPEPEPEPEPEGDEGTPRASRRRRRPRRPRKAPPPPRWPEREEWELPALYGEDAVVAYVRDPWWVFVFWELSPETRAEARRRAGEEARFVLRIHEVGDGEALLSEAEVPDITVGDWYVSVSAPRLRVRAVMGYLDGQGVFHSVFESAPTQIPAQQAETLEGEAGEVLRAALEGRPGDDAEEVARGRVGPFVTGRIPTISGSGVGFGFRWRGPRPGAPGPNPSSPQGAPTSPGGRVSPSSPSSPLTASGKPPRDPRGGSDR